MKNLNLQKGIAPIIAVIIIAILAVFGGVYYFKQQQTTKQASKSTITDETANWKTHKSTLGGFTVKYPNDWIAQGYEGTKQGLNENSNVIYFYSKLPSKDASNGDYVCVDIRINTTDKYKSLPSEGGIIATLDNGLNLYQRKASYAGKEYPVLELTKNGYTDIESPNSKIIIAFAAFNCVQGDVGSIKLTYDQQLQSIEYKQAIEILSTFQFSN